VLDAVRRGRDAEPVKLSRARPDAAPDEAGALVSLVEALLRARAHEAGLASGLVAARAELLEVVTCELAGREEPPVPLLEGWRRDLVGEEVLELLRGRRSVTVAEHGLVRSLPVEPGAS
jgi:ribonuclease D